MNFIYAFDADGRLKSTLVKDRPDEEYEWRNDITDIPPPERQGDLEPRWNGAAWELHDFTPGFDLETERAAKWNEIKRTRTAKLEGGFMSQGHPFQSDPESKTNVIGAAQLATVVGAQFTNTWTCLDNSVVTLDQMQMIQVGIDLGIHINTMHAIARNLRAQIDAAMTKEELEAVQWPSAS